jgi:hypothetical protein
VTENEMDRTLARLFQEAFDLRDGDTDAFLQRFRIRQESDAQVWAAFTGAMLTLNIAPATRWLARLPVGLKHAA